jgi:hypothetical protein
MSIDDIERRIGPCTEEDQDNLAISGVAGLGFVVAWRPNHPAKELDLRLPELRVAPITWFFICPSQAFAQHSLRTIHQAT